MKYKYLALAAVVISIFLCGCPRPSKYARPGLPVPSSWPAASGEPADSVSSAAKMEWREFFADRRLQSVIETALANNRDLRAAALNIEKAQVLFQVQRAQQYPAINLTANGEGYRVPASLSGNDEGSLASKYTIGVGTASWELDFWKRIRSLQSRALEQYLATEQARAAAQISLIASVADSWLTLAADRENLRLAQSTLAAQQARYELIARTRDIGMASDLEVSQAGSQVEAARVEIAGYSGQIALDENALNLLTGAPVAAAMLPETVDSIAAVKDIAAGIPSEVLWRRPDIAAAEHRLKAAQANIDAARAAYFPRISLTAALGIASGDLSNLFKPAAGTWNFAPQMALPLFDAGARKANYEAAQKDRDIAVAEYEKAIQTAFREVSDALSQRKSLRARQDAQDALVKTLEETLRLSDARYQGGMDSYLSVLVAQRALYAAQQQQVGIRLARFSNRIRLYKVLGGGD